MQGITVVFQFLGEKMMDCPHSSRGIRSSKTIKTIAAALIFCLTALAVFSTALGADIKIGDSVTVKKGTPMYKKTATGSGEKVEKFEAEEEFEAKALKIQNGVAQIDSKHGKVWISLEFLKAVGGNHTKPEDKDKDAKTPPDSGKKEVVSKTENNEAKSDLTAGTKTADKKEKEKDKPQDKQQDASKGQKTIRVAVYEITGSDVDKKHLALITDSIIAEIRKLEKVSAIGMNEIQALLSMEQSKQMMGCSDESCLLEIASALGADYIILGSLGKVGEESVFSLKRIDMRTGKAEHTFTKRMKGGAGEELLDSVGKAIETIFPDRSLRPGMSRGVPPEIVARWNPPPLKKWVFWTSAGATVAALALGGVFWGLQYDQYVKYKDAQSGESNVVSGSKLKDIENKYDKYSIAKWSCIGVAGGFAIATGVIALFTDWKGDVTVAPTVNQGGAGVGVKMDF